MLELTDGQIVRVLDLCLKISKISVQLPPAPAGYDVAIEVAKHLRANLMQMNDSLLELGALLR